jgi:hypothetical protein
MPYMPTVLQEAHARPKRALAFAAACAALLVLAACAGEKAVPARGDSPSAEGLLAKSAQAMAQVRSFRFSLVNENGETPLPDGLSLKSAKGGMVQPDMLHAQVTARLAGFPVEFKVISAAGRTYVSHPLTGRWQTYDYALSPVAFFDPAKGVVEILRSVREPSIILGPRTGGVATSRVSGRLPAEAVKFVTGSAIEGAQLEAELLIGTQDGLLREALLRGRIAEGEPEGMSRVLGFSAFNEAIVIEPPRS